MIRQRGWLGAGLALTVLVGGVAVYDCLGGIAEFGDLGPLGPGKQAPEFSVRRLEGGRFTREDLAGSVHVVVFWATWCPFCRDELAELSPLVGQYDDEVRFVAVNFEGGGLGLEATRTKVSGYAAQTGLSLDIALDDGAMARAFGVGPIPHTVVFDAQGEVRFVHQGRVRGSTIRDEVDQLLAR